ncbi:MAG TPA: Rha family transcriptional regulator [Bacteroidia bacterium]|jgi:phage regulator Rha-like protein|nr:Rha family transcriptional regulator [Bacteroidia bacterium]
MAYTALMTKDEIGFENNTNTITTLEIAEMMELEHWQILRKLEGTKNQDGSTKQVGIIQILTNNKIVVSDYFIPSTYKDASGKENKCYKVTKMGCDFLANKFNGEKGIIFTARYVKRFDEMERGQVPKDFPSALRAYADEVERRQIAEQENEKLQQELDYSKDWYSIKRVAAMNGVDWKTFNWRKLKEKSIELGYGVKKIFDANYGEVNTYHRDAWEVTYPEYEI